MMAAYGFYSLLILQYFFFTFLVVTVIAILLFARRLPALQASLRARNWLITEGRVETVDVRTIAEQALAEVGYSYLVDGERHAGYFGEQFADEQDAWNCIRPLKGQAITVRYKPGRAEVSAIRIADQSPLLSPREHNLVGGLIRRHLFLNLDWGDVRASGSRNWPTTKGRIESGKVTQNREGDSWYLVSFYVCEIGYSYSVGGEYYAERFDKTFFRESSAQEFTDELKGKEVLVRYRADSPGRSVLRLQDQQFVSAM
jgi:hypothetical protein